MTIVDEIPSMTEALLHLPQKGTLTQCLPTRRANEYINHGLSFSSPGKPFVPLKSHVGAVVRTFQSFVKIALFLVFRDTYD